MAGPAGYSRQGVNKNHSDLACRGFTIVELLVVISILSLLMSILIPVLARARGLAKTAVCTGNLKQLGMAFILYADDYDDYTMPTLGQSRTYWWGQILADGIDHTKGFVWPYLQSTLARNSVYECPSQRYGSYQLQGKPPGEPDHPRWITSTYGYNGYYLCPPASGWQNIKDLVIQQFLYKIILVIHLRQVPCRIQCHFSALDLVRVDISINIIGGFMSWILVLVVCYGESYYVTSFV